MSDDLELHEEGDFILSFERVAEYVHDTSIANGWWEHERNDGEMIALMHSELSEALEFLRKGHNVESDHIPGMSGVEEELADVIIRIMDYAQARGHHVASAILLKMRFNKTRTYKHGGKRF